MTDPIRTALERLLATVEQDRQSQHDCMTLLAMTDPVGEAVDAARAALSEPQGEGPTQRQLLQLAAEFWPEGWHPNEAVPFARAVLARWGRLAPPPADELLQAYQAGRRDADAAQEPPVDGEVEELVAALRSRERWTQLSDAQIDRAADLLTRLALQPVPVQSADTRYEFSVMDGDYVEQAGGSAPTLNQARDEGMRYLAQYSKDGPHTLELRRVEILSLDPTTSENDLGHG